MAKQVRQFRFYSAGNDGKTKNYPTTLNVSNLSSGGAFSTYMPITQLGIQALPGTKFYLNSATNPVIIGYTGIYELDLEGIAEINSLQFDKSSITAISNNANASLIVDIVYERDGEQ